jgi:ketosteroid isomerase-like protein
MSAADNKNIVTAIYAAMAEGDGRPFNAAMAEDFTWILEGTGAWSRTWRGRETVRRELLKPLFAQFATPYRCRAERIIAEGDSVVVLARGEVTTLAGKPYNNSYCFVIRMRDGEMVELREYLDTELVAEALEPPGAGSSAAHRTG